jgi:CRISPR/Cas system-associated endonuclease Cas3-HD
MIFERKVMRKILGPTRSDDGYWRFKTNQEINDILKGQNIIGFIKKKTKIEQYGPRRTHDRS